jgi:hypothetical protein
LKPKSKIVLASVLKPVDDTRMFEKFALGLNMSGNYDIHIIGFMTAKKMQDHPNLHYYPIFNFRRMSISRLMAPWKYYIYLLKVKPELIIAKSPDLLIVTLLFKILFGAKFLYDVQENYYLNILHTDAFPLVLRPIIAWMVRANEVLCAPFIDHFILAERVYSRQLPFIGKKFTVVENKYAPVLPKPTKKSIQIDPKKTLNLIFTGTISRHYGVLDAIKITNYISKEHPVSLKIIGRCANKRFLRDLKDHISKFGHIKLNGGEKPVSHSDIIEAIREADLGIISYLPNKSTKGRIPTKIYEYMANKLPFLALHEPEWLNLALKHRACLPVKLKQEPTQLLKELFDTTFYNVQLPENELLWEKERDKLINVVNNMIENI